jgi:hypothetical protein
MQINISPPEIDNADRWLQYIKGLNGELDNNKRKKDSLLLHRYYNGDQRGDTVKEMSFRMGRHIDTRKHPIWINNVLKYGVSLKARTYEGLIQRAIDDASKLYIFDSLNSAMITAEHNVILDRQTLIQSFVNKDDISYRVYPSYQFDLVRDENRNIIAVILSDRKTYYVYTENFTYTFKEEEKEYSANELRNTSIEPNTTGIVPFVFIADSELGYEDHLMPNIEYAHSQLELNIMLCSALYTYQLQSHSIQWIRALQDSQLGEHADDPSIVGSESQSPGLHIPTNSPANTLVLYQDAMGNKEEIGFASPNVNFDQLINMAKQYTSLYLQNMGIPPGSINVEYSHGAVKPAMSSYLADKQLEDLNANNRNMFYNAELRMFDIVSTLCDRILNIQLGDNFSIAYQPKPRSLEYLEPEELLKMKDANVIDEIEVLRTVMGITRAQAEIEFNKFVFNKEQSEVPEIEDNSDGEDVLD